MKAILQSAVLLALAVPQVFSQSYLYDAAGKLKEVRYPTGNRLLYEYDQFGNITRVTPLINLPEAPTEIDIEITGPNEALLSWQHNGDGTDFVIQKRLNGTIDWVDLTTLDNSTRSFSIANTEEEDFFLRVLINAVTPGAQSVPSPEVRFPDSVPALVTTLEDENDIALGRGTGDSLREVIAISGIGDTIRFAPVLAGGAIVLKHGELRVNKRLNIDASSLRSRIEIQGSGTSRIFAISSAPAVSLRNIKISNGMADLGGAIRNDGVALYLDVCFFAQNTATDKGGAIYNFNGGRITVDSRSIFFENSSTSGGGAIYNDTASFLDISDTTFTGNNSNQNGGAIFNNSALPLAVRSAKFTGNNSGQNGGAIFNNTTASLDVSSSSFTGNNSDQNGGAIHNIGSAFSVGYSSFSTNGAAIGGAIYNKDCNALILNSTIALNGAARDTGGGIANEGNSDLIVRHCTVCLNNGLGIFNLFPATLTLDNSIVASNNDTSNSARDFSGSYTSVGANLLRISTGSTLLSGPTPLSGDPLLGNFSSGIMPPLVGSRVIDAGVVTANTPDTDQYRSTRILGAAPDLGAIESRLSANVDLLWLTTSAGALTPRFDSTVYDYTATVSSGVTSVAVRGEKVSNNQTIAVRVNGGSFTTLNSKQASPDLALVTGENTIEVKITATNGVTTQSYIITVTRSAPEGVNQGLVSLTPATGTLTPSFQYETSDYQLLVPTESATTTLTAPAAQPGSTVMVRTNFGDFMEVSAGGLTPDLPLNIGDNTVEFFIMDSSGATTASYSITITRETSALANANLADLTTDAGTLSPIFAPGNILYRLSVPNSTTTATVTPTKSASGATIEVRANAGSYSTVASGNASASASLAIGQNYFDVKVTSEDSSATRIYTVIITRQDGGIEWISEPGNLASSDAVVSADCRFVAYSSRASNLVPDDTNNQDDIFVYDRSTGGIERISVSSAGVQGNSLSTKPSISSDGRYVAFQSSASNLVSGDSNNQTDVFVRDRTLNTTERISLRANGDQSNTSSDTPSISADGRFVAFEGGGNMIAGFNSGQTNIYIRDRDDDSLVGISIPYPLVPSNRFPQKPSISADGNFVAFEFVASLNDGNRSFKHTDIYLYNRANGAVERITGTQFGILADGEESKLPSISADGRYVAFESNLEGLDFNDTNGRFDIYVYDRITGSTQRASTLNDGIEETRHSNSAAISGNGRYVAFHSQRTMLVPGDTNIRDDVFVKDLLTGEVTLRSIGSSGAPATNTSDTPSISFDGQCVAFTSFASNLVATGTGEKDAYVSYIIPTPTGAPADPTLLTFLTSNLGAISPGLVTGTSAYSASVSSQTSLARFKPVAANPASTIRVRVNNDDFIPLPSDGLAELALLFGDNAIEIEVTAPDETSSRTYTLNVDRGTPDPSLTDATLASLVPSSGSLDSEFSSGFPSYNIIVPNATTSMSLLPTTAQTGATLTFNGEALASGNSSAALPLVVGSNNATIEVTARDGLTKFIYTVGITRSLPANADLTSLVLNNGSTSPAFNSATTEYTAAVSNATSAISFTPTAAISGAIISINGGAATSGVASTPLPLEEGNNLFFITVETGTIKTYTLEITREAAANSPIETWRQTHFTFTTNTGDAADNFDFDKDDIVNLLEFAFGSDPTLSGSGHDMLPKASKVGNNLVITFTEPAGISGITYGAETSTSLLNGTWSPVTDTGSGTTHTFSIPIAPGTPSFIRLVITNNNP